MYLVKVTLNKKYSHCVARTLPSVAWALQPFLEGDRRVAERPRGARTLCGGRCADILCDTHTHTVAWIYLLNLLSFFSFRLFSVFLPSPFRYTDLRDCRATSEKFYPAMFRIAEIRAHRSAREMPRVSVNFGQYVAGRYSGFCNG